MAEEKVEEKEEKKPAAPASDNNLAMLAHILGIFTGFVGPLIIFLVKPEEGYTKNQAKEALNFWITISLAYLVGSILMVVLIGGLIMAAAGIYGLVMGIIAAMATSKGEDYKYPFAIRLVK